MHRSAGTGFVDPEKLPENAEQFVNQTLKARLMTAAGADNFVAGVANTVCVLVDVTRCRLGGDHGFAAKTAFGSFSVLGAGGIFVCNFGKRMNMDFERAGIGFGVLLCR